jgi:tetratricopeptide (TPR) repeat protein
LAGAVAWTASFLLLSLGAAGCKTDSLANPRRETSEAPVDSLESPAGIDLPAIPLADRTEIDLVEEMIFHRALYARHLRALVTYYSEHGYENKATWARNELNDLRHVKPYRYITDAEVPVAGLEPTNSIAEADELYAEGVALMKKGGHGIPALYNQDTMKLALAKFKQLVDTYPSSDKIDDAAFMIAEIHKEYFEEEDNDIALLWYQRALDWNPHTPHPARFQMAVLLDYRMHERERALAMYQQVLEHERFNKSNLEWANARIRQLTTEKTRHGPAETVAEPRPKPTGSEAPAGEGAVASPPPARVP